MAFSRFDVRRVIVNDDQGYQEDILERRGIKTMTQYSTPILTYPTPNQIRDLNVKGVTWKRGTSLSKLAAKEYGDSKLWWIIAWFNKRPTDAHFNIGDKVFIPKPLEKIIRQFRV